MSVTLSGRWPERCSQSALPRRWSLKSTLRSSRSSPAIANWTCAGWPLRSSDSSRAGQTRCFASPPPCVIGSLALADSAVASYMPLNDFYFSPLKLGEYLAAGLPVVATACGDLDPLLRDGVSSLRVPPGNVPALARALGRLTGDPELRRRLGRAGRRVAEENLSLEAATTRLLRLLASLGESGAADRTSAAP